MSFEKFGNRVDDHGQESPLILLARIDENIKFLKSGAEAVRIQLHEHEEQDDKKFAAINRTIYLAVGGGGVVIFLLNWIHH